VAPDPVGAAHGEAAPVEAAAAIRGPGEDTEPAGLAALEASKPGLERVLEGLRETTTIQRMVAGGAAWAITIASGALVRGASGLAQGAALLALVAGLGGPALAPLGRKLARHVGISLFLLLAVLAWAASSDVLSPARFDAIRAGLGAVAWGLFALSWSDPWRPVQHPTEGDAPKLTARATLPPLAVPVASLGVLAGLLCMGLAWQIDDPDRALLAHVVSTAMAVALISAAATLATSRGKRHVPVRRFTSSALRPLVVLGVVAAAGAFLMALR
jgi:hypothetical protein